MKRVRLTEHPITTPQKAWEQRKERAAYSPLSEPVRGFYRERVLDLAEFPGGTTAFVVDTTTGQSRDVSGMKIRVPPAFEQEKAVALLISVSPVEARTVVAQLLDAASLGYPYMHRAELTALGEVLERASPETQIIIREALVEMGYTEYKKSRRPEARRWFETAIGHLMGAALAPIIALPVARFLYSPSLGFFSMADDPMFPYVMATVTAGTIGMAVYSSIESIRRFFQTPFEYLFLSKELN